MNRSIKAGAGVVLLAAAVSVAGCTSGAQSEDETFTVLSSFTPDSPEWKIQEDVIAQFEEDSGLEVEVTPAGDDIQEVFETSVVGGDEADVVIVNLFGRTLDWVANGVAVPVDDYLSDWGLSDSIKPEALDEWQNAEGQLSGFPYRGFVWPVWYNLDLLEDAGVSVPTTTDELIRAADALRATGSEPLVVGGSDWSGQKLFMQIMQSYMSPEDARAVFAEGNYCAVPSAMEGIELFTTLRDAGVFIADAEGYTADQMNATFYDGSAAIMSAGEWAFGDTPDDLNIQLGGLPIPDGGQYTQPTALSGYTGSGFFISNNGAEKIDAVRDFVSAFYTPEIAGRFVNEANGSVAYVFDEPVEITNPLLAEATADLPSAVEFAVMPDTAVPGEVADPLIRQTTLAYSPGADAQTICAGLESVYP